MRFAVRLSVELRKLLQPASQLTCQHDFRQIRLKRWRFSSFSATTGRAIVRLACQMYLNCRVDTHF